MGYFGEKLLITGGTGSFGHAFTQHVLQRQLFDEIIIYSRDEMKQWEMKNLYSTRENISFILGDVRDEQRLVQAFRGVDFIVHAAATKIVPTAETNPSECIKTNVMGALNVAQAATLSGVKKVVALSTDKASSPINLYGASKLASDKVFIASNSKRELCTKFSVVRYGNVLGSRGSVVPFFRSIPENEKIPITDKRMTRFILTLQEAAELVETAFSSMFGGEIYVKKIPSMNIMDIAEGICPGRKTTIVGIRPGEKIHEQMISIDDAINTYSFDGYFKILPADLSEEQLKISTKGGLKVPNDFEYSSNKNNEWMSSGELSQLLAAIV